MTFIRILKTVVLRYIINKIQKGSALCFFSTSQIKKITNNITNKNSIKILY